METAYAIVWIMKDACLRVFFVVFLLFLVSILVGGHAHIVLECPAEIVLAVVADQLRDLLRGVEFVWV